MNDGDGDSLYVWQAQEEDGRWSCIHTVIEFAGMEGTLLHRRYDVAKNALGPIARGHADATGQKIRFAEFVFKGEIE